MAATIMPFQSVSIPPSPSAFILDPPVIRKIGVRSAR